MAATVAAELDQELMEPPASAVDPETVDDMEIDEKTPPNSPSKSFSSPDPFGSQPPPPLLAAKHRSRINSEEEDIWKATSRKLFDEDSPPAVAPPTGIPAAAGGAEEENETVELAGRVKKVDLDR